jgi:midasin
MLAYYRLLDANGELPSHLFWPLKSLSELIWTPGVDSAVRLLAIRCYALQTRMGEGERVNIEKEVFQELWEVDCPLDYGENTDHTIRVIDGWLVPALESKRISDSRSSLANNPRQFYATTNDTLIQPIHPSELRYVPSYHLTHS